MLISKVEKRNSFLINTLYDIWNKSVKETHLFLTDNNIRNISKFVPEALVSVENLIIVEDDLNKIIGFMGIENKKIEMLFLLPSYTRSGIGSSLVSYAINNFNINKVDVNEDNRNAFNFYKKMGFIVYDRSEYDDFGNNFPILYMKI